MNTDSAIGETVSYTERIGAYTASEAARRRQPSHRRGYWLLTLAKRCTSAILTWPPASAHAASRSLRVTDLADDGAAGSTRPSHSVTSPVVHDSAASMGDQAETGGFT
jgi:hypothetical protein